MHVFFINLIYDSFVHSFLFLSLVLSDLQNNGRISVLRHPFLAIGRVVGVVCGVI